MAALLTETVTSSGKTVVLTETELRNGHNLIFIADVLGANAEGTMLQVVHFPMQDGAATCCGARKAERQLQRSAIALDTAEQAQSLAAAVWNQMHGLPIGAPPPPRKRWVVLINPASGKRRAVTIWEECRPMLEAYRVEIQAIETTHQGHAAEVVAQLRLDEVDAIVTVGGDGILHEAVNGLMERPDAEAAAAKLQIGVLPGGSGNGLSVSMVRAAGETPGHLTAAFLLCRGSRQQLDLWEVTQPQKKGYAFLSLEWALASDIDLGSEHLRFLGEMRFDIYAVVRLLWQRRYPGQLRVRNEAGDWRTIEGTFLMVWGCNVPWVSGDAQLAPRAELTDGHGDVLVIQEASRREMISAFLDLESGQHADAPFLEYIKTKEFELDPGARTPADPGMIAIDGELWPYAKTSVKVLPGKLCFLGGRQI